MTGGDHTGTSASAIAAGVERKVLMGTVVALFEARAEGGGSACADVQERLALMGRERVPLRWVFR